MFDVIGDIHGYADDLELLLQTLGYTKHGLTYQHPDRRALFLGDFIDRGPKIREVLELVRPMVEEGHALAILGNHELNALAYHTPDEAVSGKFLRRHHERTIKQHESTLKQIPAPEMARYLDWFRTLPLWLELDGLRAVHACWDDQHLATIRPILEREGRITKEFLHLAYHKQATLFKPVEVIVKGKQARLPSGYSFHDEVGAKRTDMRTRWYLAPDGHTFGSYALQSAPIECHLPLTPDVIAEAQPYPLDAKPVFIGHYWLSASEPHLLADNVACLDFSVAKDGYLCAYRWSGEQKLDPAKFVWVRAPRAT